MTVSTTSFQWWAITIHHPQWFLSWEGDWNHHHRGKAASTAGGSSTGPPLPDLTGPQEDLRRLKQGTNGCDSAGLWGWTPIHQTTGGVLGGAEIGGKGRRIPRGYFHSGPGGNTGGPNVLYYLLVDSGLWEANREAGPGRGD